MLQLSQSLYCFDDTCNVYVVRDGDEALLIDFGSGAVLDALPRLGIRTVRAIWMTHHHRDQGQGLARAAGLGIPIWVPHAEQHLFRAADPYCTTQGLPGSSEGGHQRFSLLEPVPVHGTLRDYATIACGARKYIVLPTPGHTVGSISLLVEIDGRRVVFSGDLIAAHGKTWSLAALQWGHNDACGAAASIASLLDLRDREPDWLLPSHGPVVQQPLPAIDLLAARLSQLLDLRQEQPRLLPWRKRPYQPITHHVLWNRTSSAYSYVLLSDSKKALLIDYGYDFMTGVPSSDPPTARRPWLYTLAALKRQYGVRKIDIVVPTHYQDDHVAGCNLLQEVEGAEIWAGANMADVLARPHRYDLASQWPEPIQVDRVLPLERPIPWEEYSLTLYALPGQTPYGVAVLFEADGLRFLATGDRYGEGPRWDYAIQDGFWSGSYRASAELYRRLEPDMILSAQWEPRCAQPAFIERLEERDAALERLHAELLPEMDVSPAQGLGVHIYPYRATVQAGETALFEVEITNVSPRAFDLQASLTVPEGWRVDEPRRDTQLPARATGMLQFHITPPAGLTARRARVAVDLRADGRPLGQPAEALVTIA